MEPRLCAQILGSKDPLPPKYSVLIPKHHPLNRKDYATSQGASLEATGALSQRGNVVECFRSDIFLGTNTGNCVFISSWRLEEPQTHM